MSLPHETVPQPLRCLPGRGRRWTAIAAVAAALALAACGGGDPSVPGDGSPSGAPTTAGEFTRYVSFGDSLSDVGTYAPATSLAGDGTAPYFGGRFTTNGSDGSVWVERVATALGLVVTPAEVGFGGTSVACPAQATPALAETCTAYAQGGARVTDPNGIGKDGGALTVPVATQIARHLERFGTFTAKDLVTVYAGNNDVLVAFDTFGARAAEIQAQALAGTLTKEQADAALFQAQSEAQASVKQAARELTALIREQLLGQGAKYVAVMNLSDIGETPLGQSLSVEARGVLTSLCELFNLWLRDGLDGQPVQIFDTYAVVKDSYQHPEDHGITNVTVPACDKDKIATITGGRVTTGSSLFCNATVGAPYYGLRDGADPETWLFADPLHPSSKGHRDLADEVGKALAAYGWI